MISSLKLAKICGVSQGTIDRALHDRPGINPETRKLVLEAAQKYGYRPHPAAYELLGGSRTMIGAIVPKLTGVFFMDLLNGIRDVLVGEGYRFFICPSSDSREFIQILEDFAARRCCATIVIPPEDDLPVPKYISENMPVISLLSPCKGRNVYYLSPNEVQTGRDAVAWLFENGHKNIIHLTYQRRACAIIDRAAGYTSEMQKRGLRPLVLTAPDKNNLPCAIRDTQATALFCHNDWLALQAMRMLMESGLKVPEDISVLGVDNSPTFKALCPDITTMQYPVTDIAEYCRDLILNGKGQRRIGRLTIIERQTVRKIL